MRKIGLLLLCLVCLSGCASGSLTDHVPASKQRNNSAPGFLEVNADNPGEIVDIKSSIVFGKLTIIAFSSPYCPPCQAIKPMLEQMHDKRPDIVVRYFDVNRSDVQGIDFESPLAVKYEIHVLPSFKIFNERGKLIAEGAEAKQEVIKVINEDILRARQE